MGCLRGLCQTPSVVSLFSCPDCRDQEMNQDLEASKGGMKVGRIKDPLYKDSYFGITPPTFIPPFEAPEECPLSLSTVGSCTC